MTLTKCAFYLNISKQPDTDSFVMKNAPLLAELMKNWWIQEKYKNEPDAIEEIAHAAPLVAQFGDSIEKWLRKIVEWSAPFGCDRIYLYSCEFDEEYLYKLAHFVEYSGKRTQVDYEPLYLFETVSKLIYAPKKREITFNVVSELIYDILRGRSSQLDIACLDFFTPNWNIEY